MLCVFETYESRKASILDTIKVTRQFARAVNETIKKYPSLRAECQDCINDQDWYINQLINELMELERWNNEQKSVPNRQATES